MKEEPPSSKREALAFKVVVLRSLGRSVGRVSAKGVFDLVSRTAKNL